jgi:hypothetical protein
MVAVANELRAAHSASFIVEQLCEVEPTDPPPPPQRAHAPAATGSLDGYADRALWIAQEAVASGGDCIIESIRTTGEVFLRCKRKQRALKSLKSTPFLSVGVRWTRCVREAASFSPSRRTLAFGMSASWYADPRQTRQGHPILGHCAPLCTDECAVLQWSGLPARIEPSTRDVTLPQCARSSLRDNRCLRVITGCSLTTGYVVRLRRWTLRHGSHKKSAKWRTTTQPSRTCGFVRTVQPALALPVCRPWVGSAPAPARGALCMGQCAVHSHSVVWCAVRALYVAARNVKS